MITVFHAICVGIFLLTSIVHMGMVCSGYLDHSIGSYCDKSVRLRLKKTLVVKRRIAVVNFFAIVAALYLYDRHNRYCEPGVYSMFSFLEYIVIVANIVYHLQACTDLGSYSINIVDLSSAHSIEGKKIIR